MRLAPESDPVACYRAAVDMAAFGEGRGAVYAAVSEHHGSPDGYLPSPAVLASAIAARTSSLPILVAAALLPFYDPVRLAEDMTVLHHLSNGRVSWVLGLGYRPEEFEMFGVERGRRGAVADEKLELLLKCLEGEPFEAGSRRIRVTPGLPAGRPSISWGGGTAAAARRAARFGLDFFAQTNIAGLENAYRKEAERRGIAPGKCVLPDPSDPMSVFVADDVDRAWDELAPTSSTTR